MVLCSIIELRSQPCMKELKTCAPSVIPPLFVFGLSPSLTIQLEWEGSTFPACCIHRYLETGALIALVQWISVPEALTMCWWGLS